MGLIAAALVGFSPDLITIQSMLLTELSNIFLIILTVYLFFRYINGQKTISSALMIGLAFAGAVLIRPTSIIMILPMTVYFMWSKNLKHLVLIILTLAAALTPWTIRNYKVYGVFMPTNAALGYNLLAGNHHGATGEQVGSDVEAYVAKYGYIKANQIATKEALKFIAQNPLEFISITIRRVSIYFSFTRPTGFWFHFEGLSKMVTLASSSLYSIILFIFGFLGILQYKQFQGDDRKRFMLFLSMLLTMPLAVIGLVVETRYRMPVYPFFAVFAGLGIVTLKEKINWKQLAYVSLALFANAGIDAAKNISRIFDKINHL